MSIPVPLSSGQVLTVPTSWGDVTLGQYVSLVAPDPDEPRTAAEVLLHLEPGALDNLAAKDVPCLANLLAFVEDQSPLLELLPTPGLPSVGELPWGCLVLVQQHFAGAEGRPDAYHLAYVLSVYRTQLTWGKVDETRRAACEAALLATSVPDVYAEASFFLTAWRKWQPDTPPTTPIPASPPTKSLRPTPTRRFLSALGWPSRWMPSPGATS